MGVATIRGGRRTLHLTPFGAAIAYFDPEGAVESAAPEHYGGVSVLRNGTASYENLKNKLFVLTREGKLIDLFILTHGRDNEIAVVSGITGEKIRQASRFPVFGHRPNGSPSGGST